MTTFRSRTESIDTMFISTYQKAFPALRDQIFDTKKSALWALLKAKGGFKAQSGGDYIKFDLEYAKNPNIDWVQKGEEVVPNDYEFMEQARFKWKHAVKSITRFWHDDRENQGESQVHNMIVEKLRNSTSSFKEDLDSEMFSDNNATSAKIHGLQHLIADDPTASLEVGEINQSTYSWWRNQTLNWTTSYSATAADWLANGVSEMRQMIQNVVPEGQIDLILCNQTVFNLMQDDLLTYFNWDGRLPPDLAAPTRTLAFDGIPVEWSKNIGNRMYFLNLSELKYYYDPNDFLTLTPWMNVVAQPKSRVAYLTLASQFCVKSRRAHGVIYNLPS